MFIFSSHTFNACSLGYTGLLPACPTSQLPPIGHYAGNTCQDYRCDTPHPRLPREPAKEAPLPPPGAGCGHRPRIWQLPRKDTCPRPSTVQDSNPGPPAQHGAASSPPRCPSLLQPAGLLTAVNSGDPTRPCLTSQRHCRHPAPFAPRR